MGSPTISRWRSAALGTSRSHHMEKKQPRRGEGGPSAQFEKESLVAKLKAASRATWERGL